jgi:hypothetical protein
VCCGAIIAAAAGCGGSPSSTASGPPASGSSSSTASGSASPSASAGPFAGLTADQIGRKALADLRAAASFHIAGSVADSGKTVTLDVSYGTSDCKGTIGVSGEGSMLLLKKGRKLWLKPDDRFWKGSVAGRLTQAQVSLLEGKYLEPEKDRDLTSLAEFCDRRKLADSFAGNMTGMSKGKTTTISGQPVQQVLSGKAKVYVTISARPEFVRIIDDTQHGRMNFTGYGAPVSVTAPPADETLNGATFGF